MFDTKTYVKHIFKAKKPVMISTLTAVLRTQIFVRTYFWLWWHAHGPAVYVVSVNVFLFIVIEQIRFYLFERLYCYQTL